MSGIKPRAGFGGGFASYQGQARIHNFETIHWGSLLRSTEVGCFCSAVISLMMAAEPMI